MLYNSERPYTFDGVVGQTFVVDNIRNQAKNNKWFSVYILAGQFGSGKTTMARIISLASNCEHLDQNGNPCLKCSHCLSILEGGTTDILEIDAATNTGIDSVRELRENVSFVPSFLKYKVYIIDEVHMLSKGAFNALLKILEEPPKHVIFILCTTESNAIPATVRSRAANYTFEQISHDNIVGHLIYVAEKNSITITEDAITLIAKNSQGAMRNALSLLDQVSNAVGDVNEENVRSLLGITNSELIIELCKKMLKADTLGCIQIVEELTAQGRDLSLLCNDLIDIVSDSLVAKIGGLNILKDTEQYINDISAICEIALAEQLCTIASQLHKIKESLRKNPGKTTLLVGIIGITTDVTSSYSALVNSLGILEKKIVRLEKMIKDYSYQTSSCPAEETISEDDSQVVAEEQEVNVSNTFASNNENMVSEKDLAESETKEELKHGDNSLDESKDINEKENVEEANENNSNDVVIDNKDVGPQPTIATNDSMEFDIFDMFDDIDTSNSQENPSNENNGSSEDVNKAMQTLEDIAQQDNIFAVALKGCNVTKRERLIEISTPLQPIKSLLDAYISSYIVKGFELTNIVVQLNKGISLKK